MQCYDSVNIGVMMAQKHNCFVCKYAHRSCLNFDGRWVSHSVQTMSVLVEEVDNEIEGLVVLPVESGFYPLCFDAEGLHQLYREDFDTFPLYNKSEIYAVHLFARKVETTVFPTTVNNMSWIQNSKSLVAISIRESLPSGFFEHNLNTTECSSK